MFYYIHTANRMATVQGQSALKQALERDFSGEHVSVKYKSTSNLQQVRFASVDSTGHITDTYRPNLGFNDMEW